MRLHSKRGSGVIQPASTAVHQRQSIAEEIVRRVDTVTLCTCAEVTDIYRRAQAGEFDEIFDSEKGRLCQQT
jgi:hypothetical protein